MGSKAGSKFLFCRAFLSENRFALFRTQSSRSIVRSQSILAGRRLVCRGATPMLVPVQAMEILTKAAARNIFYSGSIFSFAIFSGLVAHNYVTARAI